MPEPAAKPGPTGAPTAPASSGAMVRNLFDQQAWVIRLRWIAGLVVLSGGILEATVLHWYGTGIYIAITGAAILACNILFAALSRRIGQALGGRKTVARLYALVWGQILLDLVFLTLLVALTGGYQSPLRGFFVCHMVFASLLLDRVRAFGVALVAIGMVEGTLAATAVHAPTTGEIAIGLGWDLTLLATVYVAGRITRSLRRAGRRLLKQNRRIRRMSIHLRRQQQLMIQQEKMFAMGQMAAGVAHEVANPLASMDGLLQLLERRPELTSPEKISRLREQIARITQIVRQLTDFAHAGGSWTVAGLNDVVARALEVVRFDRRVKHIHMERIFDPSLPVMRLQPAALEQVIINMVINAADAMDGLAEPRLTVRTALLPGGIAELSLEDNGVGIPENIRDRIFEPFFTTKPVGKGTGLGLSISYTLVRKHEGEILVSSAPGKGTRFTIRLPVRTPPSGDDPAVFSSADSGLAPALSAGPAAAQTNPASSQVQEPA